MGSEKFCLRWNDFETNISVAFRELREEKDFFDVTLACDDSQIQAHKVILSACSPFFRNVLRRNPHQHPLLYLKGVKYTELLSVLNFMYLGEVNVAQDELNSFLSVAEDLRVKGLTQGNAGQPKPKSTLNCNNTKKEPPERDHNSKRHCPNPQQQPKQFYQTNENMEIQEVFPVKAEPKDPVTTVPTPSQLLYTTPQVDNYQTQEEDQGVGETDQEIEQRTVALDESYGADEAYDYQYEGYGNGGEIMDPISGMSGAFPGSNGSSDLDSAIHAKLSKTAAGEWQCNDCFRTSRFKTNIVEHIEATHIESTGYNCDICFKFYKNRHSLRNHKNLKHKEMKHIQPAEI
eukprot:GFUD01024565.1.p1 GENE.GFUD01024565.1~~GFUD01024565.1.p1  ORF type:complete len:346 (-),score=66.62 GFUD01024565.1:186-1223(-)